jgi:hypothetical protein
MEATGGDMMAKTDKKRARSVKRKALPLMAALNHSKKKARGSTTNPKLMHNFQS